MARAGAARDPRMTRMIRIRLALLAALAMAPAVGAGTVRTLDGKSYEGDIRFDPKGKVLVTPPGQTPVEVDFQDLLHVTFAASPRTAASPGEPPRGLLGVYYADKDLAGRYVSRIDRVVDFNWAQGYPVAGIETDAFSARWSGRLTPPETGDYTFVTRMNDGVRLWVDHRLLIDRWTPPEGLKEWSGTIRLEKGKSVELKLEFYDTGGNAEAHLLWKGPGIPEPVLVPADVLTPAPPPPPYGGGDARKPLGNGLLAIYYGTRDLAGPAVTRIDPKIDFPWGDGAPLPGIGADNFSVRWIGQVKAPTTDAYTFHTVTDDGVRLWINNHRIIDQWQDQSPSEASGAFALKAGQTYDIRMEYYEGGGGAHAQLFWSSPSRPKEIIPSDCLIPVSTGSRLPAEAAAPVRLYPIQGLVLRNGGLIKAQIERADDSVIRFHRDRQRDLIVSTSHVACIIPQAFPPAMASKIPPGRKGVLLKNGDFFEGEIRYIRDGRIRVSSVLFGLRDLGYWDALAIVYHDPSPLSVAYEIHLTDGSVLKASGFTAEKDYILVKDLSAGPLQVWAWEVREIACGGSRFQPLSETRLAKAVLPPGLSLSDALGVDALPNGMAIWMGGKPVDRGLAMAAGSSLTYDLGGAYRVFFVQVGTCDGAPAGARLRFVIDVDGAEAYRSPEQAPNDASLDVSVRVSGARTLTLRVEPTGILDPAALAIWARPLLVRP